VSEEMLLATRAHWARAKWVMNTHAARRTVTVKVPL
jgi:hypothetical protein